MGLQANLYETYKGLAKIGMKAVKLK